MMKIALNMGGLHLRARTFRSGPLDVRGMIPSRNRTTGHISLYLPVQDGAATNTRFVTVDLPYKDALMLVHKLQAELDAHATD